MPTPREHMGATKQSKVSIKYKTKCRVTNWPEMEVSSLAPHSPEATTTPPTTQERSTQLSPTPEQTTFM